MDIARLDLAQRLIVSEAMGQFREEDGGQEAVDDLPTPVCFYPGNVFEEQRHLVPERIRPSIVEGQDWPNVEPTRSNLASVKKLLRDCSGVEVTFIIPRKDQRPWSPLKGYQCMYESYFQYDTELWFPIPRLIASYSFRRDAAINQFLNGSFRLAVALMVMSAEAGRSLNVRAFEELTSIKSSSDGLLSVKIRLNYIVVTGHPNKTSNWQRSYFYIKSNKAAFKEPPKTSFRVLLK